MFASRRISSRISFGQRLRLVDDERGHLAARLAVGGSIDSSALSSVAFDFSAAGRARIARASVSKNSARVSVGLSIRTHVMWRHSSDAERRAQQRRFSGARFANQHA